MTLSHRSFLLASLLCVALASALFLPGLPGSFVLDDVNNIVQNSSLHLKSMALGSAIEAAYGPQPGGMTRFLPMLTFALDHARAGGLDPATFKATNIFIHALTTLALALFLLDLLKVTGAASARARWAALALSLAWAIHPLQVSSVLYVVQRMQTLATLFSVMALWVYLQARQAQIEGRNGRTGWILAGLLWAIAVGCKEDAVLLPAYLLALELTVLRFRAADSAFAHKLQRGYLIATMLGAVVFLFLVAPYVWSWDAYPGRNFSSVERLLTQGRVLCLYLWQMLVPLPSHMPFYYDWLQPSRGLFQPWSTLPAWLLLSALLASAWRCRHRRPLFAFGVLVFFAGHFVTSNLIPLELAFEHRNHFPLIGIVIAAGDLLALVATRLHMRSPYRWAVVIAILASLAGATVLRARSWNSGLALAMTSTQLAPKSVRAWNALCVEWYELGGGQVAGNPHLDKALPACSKAAELAPDSVASLTNVLAFKTLQGSATQVDWDVYLQRLKRIPMNGENVASMWTMIGMVRKGIALDEDGLLAAIETTCKRAQLESSDFAAVGLFILGNTGQPDRAYAYFAHAVRISTDRAFAQRLIDLIRKEGRAEWATQLQAMIQAPA
jgi:hypothetical protein